MTPHKRTGRQRFRIKTRLFREPLLILQHEWEGYDPDPMFEVNRRYWADAKLEHLPEAADD